MNSLRTAIGILASVFMRLSNETPIRVMITAVSHHELPGERAPSSSCLASRLSPPAVASAAVQLIVIAKLNPPSRLSAGSQCLRSF